MAAHHLVILLLALFVTSVACERKRYDGYQILEITPTSHRQREYVHQLSLDIELDFTVESRVLGVAAELVVPPDRLNDIQQYLQDGGVPYRVTNENLQEFLDSEWARLDARHAQPGEFAFDLTDFNTYEDMMEEMENMVRRCPVDDGVVCGTRVLGQSYQGRDIKVLEITKEGAEGRRAFWIDSLIHAREWLTGTTIMHFLDRMTRNYTIDGDVREFIDQFDFYFLPVMNPDGYVYTWDTDRQWRKSRGDNPGATCIGTDLNRNYDLMWGNDGSSTNPCSGTYQGSAPASEPETQLIQREALAKGDSIISWVSMHTSGQMWLHPYGYTGSGGCQRAADHDELNRVVQRMAEATEAVNGTRWTRGSICETIYPASGSTIDFCKDEAGVKYGYSPELRGGSNPGRDIIEVGYREAWAGIDAMIREVEQ